MTVLSPAQIMDLVIQYGFPEADRVKMVAIALAESGGDTDAINTANSNGSVDRGLFQINSIHGYEPSSLFDPQVNAQAAKSIYGSQGITAWSTYNNGAYLEYMDEAQAVSTGGGAPIPTTSPDNQGYPSLAPSGFAMLDDFNRPLYVLSGSGEATISQAPAPDYGPEYTLMVFQWTAPFSGDAFFDLLPIPDTSIYVDLYAPENARGSYTQEDIAPLYHGGRMVWNAQEGVTYKWSAMTYRYPAPSSFPTAQIAWGAPSEAGPASVLTKECDAEFKPQTTRRTYSGGSYTSESYPPVADNFHARIGVKGTRSVAAWGEKRAEGYGEPFFDYHTITTRSYLGYYWPWTSADGLMREYGNVYDWVGPDDVKNDLVLNGTLWFGDSAYGLGTYSGGDGGFGSPYRSGENHFDHHNLFGVEHLHYGASNRPFQKPWFPSIIHMHHAHEQTVFTNLFMVAVPGPEFIAYQDEWALAGKGMVPYPSGPIEFENGTGAMMGDMEVVIRLRSWTHYNGVMPFMGIIAIAPPEGPAYHGLRGNVYDVTGSGIYEYTDVQEIYTYTHSDGDVTSGTEHHHRIWPTRWETNPSGELVASFDMPFPGGRGITGQDMYGQVTSTAPGYEVRIPVTYDRFSEEAGPSGYYTDLTSTSTQFSSPEYLESDRYKMEDFPMRMAVFAVVTNQIEARAPFHKTTNNWVNYAKGVLDIEFVNNRRMPMIKTCRYVETVDYEPCLRPLGALTAMRDREWSNYQSAINSPRIR